MLNLELDLIFFDATSTYFETEDADELVWRDDQGLVVAPTPTPTLLPTTMLGKVLGTVSRRLEGVAA